MCCWCDQPRVFALAALRTERTAGISTGVVARWMERVA